MIRDNDYIRKLLLEIESSESPTFTCVNVFGMSPEEKKRRHHVLLLCDAGLATELRDDGSIFRLTSQGHDFIEAIRDNDRWKEVKDKIAELGGAVTIKGIYEIALKILESSLI